GTLPFGPGALPLPAPAALVGLLVLPLFLLPVGRGRRAWLAAGCRALATVGIVLVLAGVHVEVARPGAGVCLVAAIDVSASVQGAARATAADYLARIVPALGTSDLLGTIAFAGRPQAVVPPGAPPPPPPRAAGRRAGRSCRPRATPPSIPETPTSWPPSRAPRRSAPRIGRRRSSSSATATRPRVARSPRSGSRSRASPSTRSCRRRPRS